MFGLFGRSASVLFFILYLSGCSAFSSFDGGFDPSETLFFDDEYELSTSLGRGEVLALDVLIPSRKGYKVVGASFDPDMLRLEHYIEYEDGGALRARYFFTTLLTGVTSVLIKMQPLSGGDIEIYKQVIVNIVEDGGLF